MARIACLCFLLVTAAAGAAHAQGLYLPNQTSGIGVIAGVDYNQDAFGVGLGAGYSYKAFIDGGIVVHRYGFTTSEANLSAIGVQPYVNVHLLRQSDTIPVSLAAVGSYQQYFYSIDVDNRDLSGYGFFLGGAGYRRFGLSETVSVTPQATLGYDFRHTRGGQGLLKVDRDDGGLMLQLAANLGFQSAGGGTIWGLNPFMTVDTNYVTFGLAFGATFPVGRK
ncbi:MAG TPA: hypothetical protein VN914_05385 [Polyangia bacterium]|nr:hypothetical protein [Polyangia bacterium]